MCALLFVYFENKAREQNHKISSMLSLVSSLTEEVHSIRRHIMQGGSVIKQNTVHYENNTNDEDLVSVSDDDENDDEQDDYDEDDDEQDEDDNEEDDDDDEQDDDEDKFDIMEEIGQNVIEIGDNVKILTLLQPIELVSDGEDESDNEEFDVDELGSSDDEEGEDQTNNLSVDKSETHDVKIFDLKSIHLEEPPIVDYKKLSVGKLKTVVAEKGLAQETSKMKKHELLKLLGVDE